MSRPVSSSSGCRQDERGEYVYRRGALGQAKGWVKSPLGAVLALAEFCGPTAPPVPWVQLAACAEEQAVPNTYSLIWTFLSENESKRVEESLIKLSDGKPTDGAAAASSIAPEAAVRTN